MEKIIDDFTDEDKVVSDTNIWDYKSHPTLVGAVVSIEGGPYGKKIQVSVNEEGDLITLPNLTALADFMNNLKVGQKVKLVHTGTVKSATTNRNYEAFDLWVK